MKNMAIPGVFPLVIALMLAFTAFRAHQSLKRTADKRYKLSRAVCIAGVVIFVLIAVFQILEANGSYYGGS